MFEENRYDHLYMAIMELPENLRILITLYYIEDFSLIKSTSTPGTALRDITRAALLPDISMTNLHHMSAYILAEMEWTSKTFPISLDTQNSVPPSHSAAIFLMKILKSKQH